MRNYLILIMKENIHIHYTLTCIFYTFITSWKSVLFNHYRVYLQDFVSLIFSFFRCKRSLFLDITRILIKKKLMRKWDWSLEIKICKQPFSVKYCNNLKCILIFIVFNKIHRLLWWNLYFIISYFQWLANPNWNLDK